MVGMVGMVGMIGMLLPSKVWFQSVASFTHLLFQPNSYNPPLLQFANINIKLINNKYNMNWLVCDNIKITAQTH